MRKAFLILLALGFLGPPCYAGDEDVQARRKLRERRERLRVAHKRIQECLATANLDPCFNNPDVEIAQALLRYYEKRNQKNAAKNQIFWANQQ